MSSAMTTQRATLIGLLAPLCWGMGVSLVRGIAEGFGLAQGQTLLYTTAAVCLFFVIGIPDLRTVDRRYLIFGLPTANASSLCFTLSIFFSAGGTQTMEAAMVNYLWPALTLLFAVVFNGVRSRWWIAPGMVLAFCGIVEILAGGQGFSLEGFISRLLEHPLSYILAVGAAVTWAAFCGFGTQMVGEPSAHGWISVILGGIAMGGAYAAWTQGMTKGNITVLAAASYFTPVLSCVFAVFWIGAKLDSSFWTGVAAVVVGSLLCWDATARGMKPLLALEAQGRTSAANRIWLHLTGRGSKR